MLGLEIATWIALGVVFGAVTHHLSTRKPAWFEVLLAGAVGGFGGGYLFRGGPPGSYSGVGLVTAGVGAIVFLVLDWLFHGEGPSAHRPQT